MKALTARQAQILAFIQAHAVEYGFTPTFREIAAEIGAVSTNAINCHLNAIEKKGAIRRTPCEPGITVLTPEAEAMRAFGRALLAGDAEALAAAFDAALQLVHAGAEAAA